MHKLLMAILIAVLCVPAFAQVQVRGYYRKDGTYVAPHIRSAPNSTTSDNYGPSSSSPLYTGRGSVTPPSTRDSDGDGVANMFDFDDDNDGTFDDADSSQYNSRSTRLIPLPSFGVSGLSDPSSDVNYENCRFGNFGCDKSRLTDEQLAIVYRAELTRNYDTCRFGNFGCDKSRLTDEQLAIVYRAELTRNYDTCRFGNYGCDVSRLTITQRQLLGL